jgi:hypothetical protein
MLEAGGTSLSGFAWLVKTSRTLQTVWKLLETFSILLEDPAAGGTSLGLKGL